MAAGFTSVRADGGLMPFIPDYRFVNLSHFPYIGDSHDSNDRWGEYRLKDYGTTILHGHTHSKKKISRSSRGTLQINVGVDAWSFFPVSEVAILALIEAES
jgi:calcineurin-like phosphoesterase family protein